MHSQNHHVRVAVVVVVVAGFIAGMIYLCLAGKWSVPIYTYRAINKIASIRLSHVVTRDNTVDMPVRQTPQPAKLAPWIHYSVVSGSNEVKNGGFENGLSDWHLPAGATLDETFKYSGKASLRLEGNPNENISLTQYLPNPKPNTRYRLTYAIKTREVIPNTNAYWYFCGVCGAALNVWAGKDKNLWFPSGGAMTGSTHWTVLGFDFDTAPKPVSDKYYLRINLDHASGVAWFDDVEIYEIGSGPEQTPPR